MAYAKLSLSQAASINLARMHADDDTRKLVKKDIFAAAKAAFGIPASTKLKCETVDTAHTDYLVLKDSSNDSRFALDLLGYSTAGAPTPQAAPQRWFKVSAADARVVLEDFLEDFALDNTLQSLEDFPEDLHIARTGIAIDPDNGDMFIKAHADRFDN